MCARPVLVFALALLLCAGVPAFADDAASPSILQNETLTGNWFGYGKKLQDAGILIGADEIFDALADPVGGRKQGAAFEGRFELFATIDLAATLGWNGAIVHANAYQIHGRGLSTDDVGNILTVNNIGATPATRLFSLWLQQSFYDDALSIRVGQIAADDEFFVSQYAALFINSTFGWPSVLGVNLPDGGPAYPLATPGARVRLALSPDLIVTAAVFNGDPAPPGPGDPQALNADGTDFRVKDAAFLIGELAYQANLPLGGDDLPGTYKIGAWYHNGGFGDQRYDAQGQALAGPASTGVPQIHSGDYGGYLIIDQLLWRKSGMGDQGLGAFLRTGAAPGDRNLIAFHADGGLSYVGPLPGRDSDVVGIGFSYERIGSARRGWAADLQQAAGLILPPADFESAVEFSYQMQVAPWWIVQPDAQVILHPGAHLPNPQAPAQAVPATALILGVRTAISL